MDRLSGVGPDTGERTAERRLELALEATGLGLWEYRIDTGDLYWSPQTRAFFGIGPDEPVSFEAYQAAIHPEDSAISRASFEKVWNDQGGDFRHEHRIIARDGTIRWLLSHGRVIAEGGEPRLIVGTSM